MAPGQSSEYYRVVVNRAVPRGASLKHVTRLVEPKKSTPFQMIQEILLSSLVHPEPQNPEAPTAAVSQGELSDVQLEIAELSQDPGDQELPKPLTPEVIDLTTETESSGNDQASSQVDQMMASLLGKLEGVGLVYATARLDEYKRK